MLRQNQTLYRAYLLKEELVDIMEEKDVGTAMTRLEIWKQNVRESVIKEF